MWDDLKFKKALGFTVCTLVLLSFLGSLPFFVVEAVGENWLTGYAYRRSHIVTNSTGAGTNYQVRIIVKNGTTEGNSTTYVTNDTITVNNKVRADFGDVNWTDDDGSTCLSYWNESTVSGVSATFWVKINDDCSSVNNTIYMYYGNSSITSASSISNTGIYGDDFPSGSSVSWSNYSNVLATSNATYAHSGTYSMKVTSSASGGGSTYHTFTNQTAKVSIMYYSYVTAAGNRVAGLQDFTGSVDNFWVAQGNSATDVHWQTYSFAGWLEFGHYTQNIWNKVEIILDIATDYCLNLLVNETSYATNEQFKNVLSSLGTYVFMINTASQTQYIDDFFLRKYVSTEPAHGGWGTEESSAVATVPPVIQDFWINSTWAGQSCLFSFNVTDSIALVNATLQTNCTGSDSNGTGSVSLSGTVAWANFTVTLPVNPSVVQFQFWVWNNNNTIYATTGVRIFRVYSFNSPSTILYLRSDEHTVNTVSGYILNSTQSSSGWDVEAGGTTPWAWGIKVYAIAEGNQELVALTSGIIANVSATSNGYYSTSGYVNNYSFANFVALSVWVYGDSGAVAYTERAKFILPASPTTQNLTSTNWNVTYNFQNSGQELWFGSSDYNTRIENVSLNYWNTPFNSLSDAINAIESANRWGSVETYASVVLNNAPISTLSTMIDNYALGTSYNETYVYADNTTATGWTNSGLSCDNLTTTSASTSWSSAAPTHSAYLTLNFTNTIRGNKINYWVTRSSTTVTLMYIDIANATGSWVNVYGSSFSVSAYYNVSISLSIYTAMRFSFTHTGTSSRTAYAYEIRAVNASFSSAGGDWENALKWSVICNKLNITRQQAIKYALDNFSMAGSLPKTGNDGADYFCSEYGKWELYGFWYANNSWASANMTKWNITAAYNQFNTSNYNLGMPAFRVYANGTAMSYSNRFYDEVASTIESYVIFDKLLNVSGALNDALHWWDYLNANHWSNNYGGYYRYNLVWNEPAFETSAAFFLKIISTLKYYYPTLGNWSRILTDIGNRFLSSEWNSKQWIDSIHNSTTYSVIHMNAGNQQRRLESTIAAWQALFGVYMQLNSTYQNNIKDMLSGNDMTEPAWALLLRPDTNFYNNSDNIFSWFSYVPGASQFVEDYTATAYAEILLFMQGIVPVNTSIAFPLEELGYLYIYDVDPQILQLQLNASYRIVNVPVTSSGALTFLYGESPVTYNFNQSGVWTVTFTESWNNFASVTYKNSLPTNVIYFSQIYPPTVNVYGVNSTLPGSSALFYVSWQSNGGYTLSGFKFGTNNTGIWINQTWNNDAGLGWGTGFAWGNITQTLNTTEGVVIQWQEWANDSSGNWGASGFFNISTIKLPTYSNVATNSTVWATPCNFSIIINDETLLHPNGQYIFGSNNTGIFTNQTTINFTSTPQSISIVQTLNWTNSNATSPEIIQFEWWFSDNAQNWNSTGLQTLTLYWPLSAGWNNVTLFSFDVGFTLAGINASLTYDSINWEYIVYQNSSVTAQYVFCLTMSYNGIVPIYQTTGILLIFTGAAGNWTHTYPFQGGDYGSDPTRFDLNNDGKVDMKDIALEIRHLGAVIGDSNYSSVYDIYVDGKINMKDLAMLIKCFGQSSG